MYISYDDESKKANKAIFGNINFMKETEKYIEISSKQKITKKDIMDSVIGELRNSHYPFYIIDELTTEERFELEEL